MSHFTLTSDRDQAFLRVVFHAGENFPGVFFRALYNLTKIPSLFIDPKCKRASYYASKTVGNECKKKKKSDSNIGKDFKLLNVSIYSRIYTAFDVHIAYGLGMFCCIYSKREASIYHRWWYYL